MNSSNDVHPTLVNPGHTQKHNNAVLIEDSTRKKKHAHVQLDFDFVL